jgi:hypothetical protein
VDVLFRSQSPVSGESGEASLRPDDGTRETSAAGTSNSTATIAVRPERRRQGTTVRAIPAGTVHVIGSG